MMEKNAKIYVAGHRGMVGSAILRELQRQGYTNLVLKTHKELDLQLTYQQWLRTDTYQIALVQPFAAEESESSMHLLARTISRHMQSCVTLPVDSAVLILAMLIFGVLYTIRTIKKVCAVARASSKERA